MFPTNSRWLHFLRVATLAYLGAAVAPAAPYTLAGSELRQLPTSANGHTYLLYVGYPAAYFTEPQRTFPTVYFVDAYWDFTLFSTAAGNLRVDGAIPDVLLIGIGYAGTSPDVNALRTLDLTPGADPSFDPSGQRSGRAEQFLDVLQQEIIPLAERDYRADPSFRVLAGNSFGGLFATYAAFERPNLFHGYIACSPSLWWRNGYLHRLETARAQSSSSFNKRLYFAYGTEDRAAITRTTYDFFQQLRSRNYPDLALSLREIEGERHSSLKPDAYTRGLRFVFAPRAPQPALAGVDTDSTLVAISTRGRVGAGNDVMIAGFSINGPRSRRVLIQAGGPVLTSLGVPGALQDPRVSVHTASGELVAQNDNWDNDSIVLLARQQSGASAFAPHSLDAALVAELEPGNYTAVVSGVNDTAGNALVEVYELD